MTADRGQRIDAPRRDAEKVGRPDRVEADRSRGDDVAERRAPSARRSSARAAAARSSACREGRCAPSRRRAAAPSGTAIRPSSPAAISSEFSSAPQKSGSAKMNRRRRRRPSCARRKTARSGGSGRGSATAARGPPPPSQNRQRARQNREPAGCGIRAGIEWRRSPSSRRIGAAAATGRRRRHRCRRRRRLLAGARGQRRLPVAQEVEALLRIEVRRRSRSSPGSA